MKPNQHVYCIEDQPAVNKHKYSELSTEILDINISRSSCNCCHVMTTNSQKYHLNHSSIHINMVFLFWDI